MKLSSKINRAKIYILSLVAVLSTFTGMAKSSAQDIQLTSSLADETTNETNIDITSTMIIEPTTETLKTSETETTNIISEPSIPVVEALETTIETSVETPIFNSLSYYVDANKNRYIEYLRLHPTYSINKVVTYVNIGLDKPFYTSVRYIKNQSSRSALVNKYNRLSSSYVPSLSTIGYKYSTRTLKVTPECKSAFERMCYDASKLGLRIKAVSAYRSYSYQYNLYWSKANPYDPASIARRDKVSARAGFSEHQTGLALDVVGLDLWVDDTREYRWYRANAHKYGFIIRYQSGKDKITGYSYEPWHLRYLGITLATKVYNSGLTFDEYSARYLDPQRKLDVIEEDNVMVRTRV